METYVLRLSRNQNFKIFGENEDLILPEIKVLVIAGVNEDSRHS